jgi:hypothetical protein
VAREFFRIVSGRRPTITDFRSMRDLGRPLRNRAYEREWAEGISAYDDFDRACEVARSYGFRPGRYIVKIMVPTDGTVEFKQTFDDEHHYTIYAEPERIFALVDGETVLIPGADGD